MFQVAMVTFMSCGARTRPRAGKKGDEPILNRTTIRVRAQACSRAIFNTLVSLSFHEMGATAMT
jgi:hypothetical protein